jgi:hypothetical protein
VNDLSRRSLFLPYPKTSLRIPFPKISVSFLFPKIKTGSIPSPTISVSLFPLSKTPRKYPLPENLFENALPDPCVLSPKISVG